MENVFDAQGWLTPNQMFQYHPNSNFAEILRPSWLSASLMIKSKMKTISIGQHFPHYKLLGAIGCCGNQSSDPICPRTLCSLSPTPMMLHIKFDQYWPTGLRDIKVWKCVRMEDHSWYTISSPPNSGELNMKLAHTLELYIIFWCNFAHTDIKI